MEQVINELERLSQICRGQGNDFLAFDQYLAVALDLLHYYQNVWKKNEEKDLEKGKREKVMIVLRTLFINCVSAFEYLAKKHIFAGRKRDCPYHNFRRYASLDNFIRDSRRLIPDHWPILNNLRSVRNAIVHNNSVPYRHLSFKINSTTYNLPKDQVMEVELTNLIKWPRALIEIYGKWLRAYSGK
jgi:hypothetical protein